MLISDDAPWWLMVCWCVSCVYVVYVGASVSLLLSPVMTRRATAKIVHYKDEQIKGGLFKAAPPPPPTKNAKIHKHCVDNMRFDILFC